MTSANEIHLAQRTTFKQFRERYNTLLQALLGITIAIVIGVCAWAFVDSRSRASSGNGNQFLDGSSYSSSPTSSQFPSTQPSKYVTRFPSSSPTSGYELLDWIETDQNFTFPEKNMSTSADFMWKAEGNHTHNNNTGVVQIFKLDTISGTYVLEQELFGEAENDLFGDKIGMSSDGLLLTVQTPDRKGRGRDNVGSAYIFDRQRLDDNFTLRQRFDGESANNYFGRVVKITSNGKFLFVGAFTNYAGENSGSLYFYSRDDIMSNFTLQQRLDGETSGDEFGRNFVSDGRQLFVRASNTDFVGNNSGSFYIFDRQNASDKFALRQRLDGEVANIYFGINSAVSSNGLVLVVMGLTEYGGKDSGSLYMYYRESITSNFIFVQRLDGEEEGSIFGANIEVTRNGLLLMVMVRYIYFFSGEESGSVFIFSRENKSDPFGFLQRLDGDAKGDKFGHAMEFSKNGNLAVVSAPLANREDRSRVGSIYIYRRVENSRYDLMKRLDGDCVDEQLGDRVLIKTTETSLNIHAKAQNICRNIAVHSYTLACKYSSKSQVCSRLIFSVSGIK